MTVDPTLERARLEVAQRAFADQVSARIAEAAKAGRLIGVIASVTAGAASDSNAVVTVTLRGQSTPTTANGYNRSYAPVVGHMVVCDLIDGQLLIAYSPVGAP